MRLVVELSADLAGRPVGVVRPDSGLPDSSFEDWLELLRVLEACIDASRHPRSEEAL